MRHERTCVPSTPPHAFDNTHRPPSSLPRFGRSRFLHRCILFSLVSIIFVTTVLLLFPMNSDRLEKKKKKGGGRQRFFFHFRKKKNNHDYCFLCSRYERRRKYIYISIYRIVRVIINFVRARVYMYILNFVFVYSRNVETSRCGRGGGGGGNARSEDRSTYKYFSRPLRIIENCMY